MILSKKYNRNKIWETPNFIFKILDTQITFCLRNLQDKLIVRCGDWDSQSELEDLPFQERDVEVIRVRGNDGSYQSLCIFVKKHPCFDVDNHHHNFALLFLKSAFMTTSHISPVCLPQPGAILGDQNCVSNGWGKDKFGAEGK